MAPDRMTLAPRDEGGRFDFVEETEKYRRMQCLC